MGIVTPLPFLSFGAAGRYCKAGGLHQDDCQVPRPARQEGQGAPTRHAARRLAAAHSPTPRRPRSSYAHHVHVPPAATLALAARVQRGALFGTRAVSPAVSFVLKACLVLLRPRSTSRSRSRTRPRSQPRPPRCLLLPAALAHLPAAQAQARASRSRRRAQHGLLAVCHVSWRGAGGHEQEGGSEEAGDGGERPDQVQGEPHRAHEQDARHRCGAHSRASGCWDVCTALTSRWRGIPDRVP